MKLGLVFGILVLSVSVSQSAPVKLLKKTDLRDAFIFSANTPQKTAPFGWICTEKSKARLRVICDDLGINESEGPMEELQLTLTLRDQKHEYGLRHGIHKSECQSIKRRIGKLIDSSDAYCVRGGLIDSQAKRNIVQADWVFDEIKATSGTVCEFNGCD